MKRSDLWWLPEVLRKTAALEEPEAAEGLLKEAVDLATAQGSSRLAEAAAADLATVRTS